MPLRTSESAIVPGFTAAGVSSHKAARMREQGGRRARGRGSRDVLKAGEGKRACTGDDEQRHERAEEHGDAALERLLVDLAEPAHLEAVPAERRPDDLAERVTKGQRQQHDLRKSGVVGEGGDRARWGSGG